MLIPYRRGRRTAYASPEFDEGSAVNSRSAGQLLFWIRVLDSDSNSFTVTNAVATDGEQYYTPNNLVLDSDSNSFAVI